MASILMGRICRCCLIKTPRMHKLREFIKEDVQIEDMLTQTVPNFNIELEDTAPLPVEICKECLEKLRISYEFHQQCMDTNQELRKMLGLEEDVDEEIFVTESADLNASDDFLNESDVLMEDFKKEPLDDISNGGNSSLKEPISDLADALSPSMQVDPVKIEGDLEDQKLEEGSVNDNSSDEYWPNDEKDDSDSNFFEKTKNSSEDSKPKRKYSRKVTSRSSGNTDCTQCDKKFTKSNLLKRHMSVHSMENEFVCDICQYRFSTDRRLRTHHTLKHKQTLEINIAGGPYPCPECPMIFESTKALASHKVMHMERDFKCKVCGINLKTNAAVTRHMNYKHPDVLPFKCQICDKGFPVENHLNDHMNEHLGIRKHKCEICEKTFSNTTNLAEHKRVHTGESPFLCCHCGKPFKTANVLRQHIQRHGEKNFHCPECPMKFFVKINLQKHMTSHTKIKHFVCDICGSGFTRQDSLKTHKFKHTGERPFKCEDCNMSFVFKRHLKRHKITHTGEKPHMCTYCDRAYAASGDLVKHLRTHVGEKTYFCDECPEAFKYSTDLKDHKNLHYKEKALRENKDGILNVQKIDDDVVEVDMQQSDEVILNLQENNEVVVSLQPSYNIVILPQKDEIINLPQNLIVVSEED